MAIRSSFLESLLKSNQLICHRTRHTLLVQHTTLHSKNNMATIASYRIPKVENENNVRSLVIVDLKEAVAHILETLCQRISRSKRP